MYSIEFSSSKFLPYLPEECQTNPGVYGFELAYWLSQVLLKRGIVTSYPVSEDWGWLIEYLDGDAEITLGCSSVADEGEGYRNQPIIWRIFIRQQLSLLQRLKGRSESAMVKELSQAVRAALEAEGVQIHAEED